MGQTHRFVQCNKFISYWKHSILLSYCHILLGKNKLFLRVTLCGFYLRTEINYSNECKKRKRKEKKTVSLFCLLKVRKYIRRRRFLKYYFLFRLSYACDGCTQKISFLYLFSLLFAYFIFHIRDGWMILYPYRVTLRPTCEKRVYAGLFSSCLTLFFACADFICSSECSFSLLYWTVLLVLPYFCAVTIYIYTQVNNDYIKC